MKQKWVILLMTLFIAGCIPQTADLGEEVGQVKEKLGITEYKMNTGDTVTVDNKMVRLESYDADYVTVFDVDGTKIEIRETQNPQIVNGLELTIKRYQYDASDINNNYVSVDILKYVPEEDEHLFYLDDARDIMKYHVELIGIYKDGTVRVRIDREIEDRVMEGRTELMGNLFITNVKPNYRAIASERYAILKITERT